MDRKPDRSQIAAPGPTAETTRESCFRRCNGGCARQGQADGRRLRARGAHRCRRVHTADIHGRSGGAGRICRNGRRSRAPPVGVVVFVGSAPESTGRRAGGGATPVVDHHGGSCGRRHVADRHRDELVTGADSLPTTSREHPRRLPAKGPRVLAFEHPDMHHPGRSGRPHKTR